MSDSSALSKSCPKCGAVLPSDATEGLCPKCLMDEAMEPTLISDSATPKRAAILAPEELAPHFPAYEILRMLGRGGMGAVYLARQISLNRLVAIKLLPADMNEGEVNFAERFKNEAQAMAQLNHPGIVAVYDFGQTANGLLYIVMEYIEGTDVQLMMASQGRLHSAHAMAITAHVCDALQYAHTRGIIHRDIKPSNIMVSNDGVVKVADFGLAKMSHSDTTGLTQSGVAMGTLHFMAPEALTLGTAVDLRADIYAVGVMLYQMLTGKLPQGMFELPSFQVPGLDPRYDRIVARALRDDRELRYQAALELRHDLDAIMTQPVQISAPEAGEDVAALPPVGQREKKARPQRLPQVGMKPAAGDGRGLKRKGNATRGWMAALVTLIVATLGIWIAFFSKTARFADAPDAEGRHDPMRFGAEPLVTATKDKPFINSLGMKFVPVPILDGPPDGKPVLFSVWDTRVQDYAVFVRETKNAWPPPDFEQGPTHPAVMVNWEDATAFCAWLTRHERMAGSLGLQEAYRLPSDAEWLSAVGGSDGFPWGTQWPPPERAGNYASEELRAPENTGGFANVPSLIKGYYDGYAATAPVGSFAANAFGLYDMGGNVWQWCDGVGSDEQHRALHGAAWTSHERASLRSQERPVSTRTVRHKTYGFRCVLAPANP